MLIQSLSKDVNLSSSICLLQELTVIVAHSFVVSCCIILYSSMFIPSFANKPKQTVYNYSMVFLNFSFLFFFFLSATITKKRGKNWLKISCVYGKFFNVSLVLLLLTFFFFLSLFSLFCCYFDNRIRCHCGHHRHHHLYRH